LLKKIFGCKRDEGIEEERKLHSVGLHKLYSSLNIIRMIHSRRMRWVGHVARIGVIRYVHKIFAGNLKGRDYSEDLR